MMTHLRLAALFALMTIGGCSMAGTPQGATSPSGHRAQINVSQSPPPSLWSAFSIPTASSGPMGIAQGADKNVWFTESAADKIGRITPYGTITEFAMQAGVSPTTIARSKAGKLWFTATGTGGQGIIGSITITGVVKTYLTPTASSGPYGIASGPDGNMWFTEAASSAIGVITLAGTITEYPTITPNAAPAGITAGSDGALWFAEPGAQRIGRVTTAGAMTEYTGASQPMFATLAQNGAVFFSDPQDHAIGEITTSGAISEYTISTSAQPFGIAASGNTIWYIDQSAQALQSYRSGNRQFSSDYSIPGSAPSPQLMAFGADGNIWFTESGANAIGVYDLHPQTVTPSSISFTAAGQTQSFSVSESNYTGLFTVTGCSPQIATVSPTTPATSFTVTAVAAGTCTLTVSDTQFNSSQIAVTVTTTDFGVQ
jgi:streptogramin lyase